MKILFLSRWYPYPPDNGSKIRAFNLIKHLASQHEIDLISFVGKSIKAARLTAMQAFCQQVNVAIYRPFQPSGLKATLGFLSTKPRAIIDTYNRDLEQLVLQAKSQNRYDAIIAFELDMSSYALFFTNTVKILEELEVTTQYEQYMMQTQPLKKLRWRLMWWKKSNYINRLLRDFEGCTVVSEEEQKRIQEISPTYQSIGVIPNGVDVAHYSGDFGPPKPNTLVYSGALSYHANFDAMQFFIGEILPLIQAECPDVKLAITGKRDPSLAKKLPKNEAVTFTGYLDDIRPTIAQSWISIVPLRLGGGTRLKILEAMAAGTPVVSTSKGAEGLDLTPEHDILIADETPAFAQAVLRILKNNDLRQKLSQNGHQTTQAKYDWQIIGQQFTEFIEKILDKKRAQ
ncbi:glycosyltransferase family 4 protein [Anaerolineales bacterium HSG25]|nr:glycosyltransferase family 4 protein [Anaerolineales bacterium HSG25]